MLKNEFIDTCKEIYNLLAKVSKHGGKINLEFKTKKTIKFALFLLGISTILLLVCLRLEENLQKVIFLLAFGIGLSSVVISFISSMLAYFNIPSLQKCSNPMYGEIKEYFNNLNEKYKEKNIEFIFHMQIKMMDINKLN